MKPKSARTPNQKKTRGASVGARNRTWTRRIGCEGFSEEGCARVGIEARRGLPVDGGSKETAQQIKKQTQRQRQQQHRNDRNVNAHVVALIAHVARQASEP